MTQYFIITLINYYTQQITISGADLAGMRRVRAPTQPLADKCPEKKNTGGWGRKPSANFIHPSNPYRPTLFEATHQNYRKMFFFFLLIILVSKFSARANSFPLQVKCENSWVRNFTRGVDKIFALRARRKLPPQVKNPLHSLLTELTLSWTFYFNSALYKQIRNVRFLVFTLSMFHRKKTGHFDNQKRTYPRKILQKGYENSHKTVIFS